MTSGHDRKASIALVCEGDAESEYRSFSGTAHSILSNLRAVGHDVRAVDAELYGVRRLLAAARCFSPDRRAWRAAFRLGGSAFAARSRHARRLTAALPRRPDAVLQIGATFAPPVADGQPYTLYCDWNMRLAERFKGTGQSPASVLAPGEAAAVDRREADIYAGAAAIFTISERLRAAFVEDYGIPAERIVVAYPGPNMDVRRIPPRATRATDAPPTVLFVGKDFERKGGDVLLAAFARVRASLPTARLRIVGPSDIGAVPQGVELLGPLSKDDPAEWARLVDAYATADAFCLPTRYEPLGIVVIEAMYFGVPCVTSDTWAMSEMVADGETGYVVPVDDAARLAAALERLLRDPARARAMGEAGRARAAARFSWLEAARRMSARLEELTHGRQ
jgi:glycosyltransferase involved in cell wall biosynthesis